MTPVETEICQPRVAIFGMRVREMRMSDIQRVSELERQSFSTPWSPAAVAFEITNNPLAAALVAESQGKVMAYLIGWWLDDEAHIGTLNVDPGFRRKGIGSWLLQNFIERMKVRKVRRIHLEVRSSNLAAQQLYFKHGFKRVGLRKNYYSREKEDAQLLSLYLEEGANDGLV